MKKSHAEIYVPAEGRARHQAIAAPGPGNANNGFGSRDDAKDCEQLCPGHSIAVGCNSIGPISAYATADQDRIQFCWAMGKLDHTIYFAEIENREDRLASFDALLELSGIDHDAVKCTISDSATHFGARGVDQKLARIRVRNREHNVLVGSRLLERDLRHGIPQEAALRERRASEHSRPRFLNPYGLRRMDGRHGQWPIRAYTSFGTR